ncbi:hypothetical protein BU23DRAFT_159487 [Bimuria novae-zelandiae CBS 107.79]|uniref:Uncharacterized protein n=1 Tax=Bimuria novae-zelandiae CBS 107.79 TaxID=1447943 RepID=A0A6A5VGR4_9PLEO|nr:hypothetical protein BU23DRAFT_159487 [Bimuria novae-zelandiae CBS 107.79]
MIWSLLCISSAVASAVPSAFASRIVVIPSSTGSKRSRYSMHFYDTTDQMIHVIFLRHSPFGPSSSPFDFILDPTCGSNDNAFSRNQLCRVHLGDSQAGTGGASCNPKDWDHLSPDDIKWQNRRLCYDTSNKKETFSACEWYTDDALHYRRFKMARLLLECGAAFHGKRIDGNAWKLMHKTNPDDYESLLSLLIKYHLTSTIERQEAWSFYFLE